MSPNFEYIAVVLDDYCDMQTSGFIPTANRYPVADVQEQITLLGSLQPVSNTTLANRIAELEREVSMHRNSEITWEITMMQAVGEDGPKSVVEAIDKIKAERDALAVHLAAIQQAWACAGRWPDSPTQLTNLAMAIEATPQQHLANLRAEAVLDAVNFFTPALDIETESLEWYAESIRQGGAA